MTPAIQNAFAAMKDQAAITLENVISSGAKYMVNQPWRICRAVYPHQFSHWPMDKDASAVLSDCRKQIAYLVANHRVVEISGVIALKQAERALLKLTISSKSTIGKE